MRRTPSRIAGSHITQACHFSHITQPRHFSHITQACHFSHITQPRHFSHITQACHFSHITQPCHFSHITQACQYDGKNTFSLGVVNSNMKWFINSVSESDFNFTIAYTGGENDRYACTFTYMYVVTSLSSLVYRVSCLALYTWIRTQPAELPW